MLEKACIGWNKLELAKIGWKMREAAIIGRNGMEQTGWDLNRLE